MTQKKFRCTETENRIIKWMARNAILLLRVSTGIIFFWFGILKYFDGMSPAEGLAVDTIDIITFGLFSEKTILVGLATWEAAIGIGLIFNVFIKQTLILLLLQMAGTFMPVILFTDQVFHVFPYSFTLEGQYIVKNIVIISAAIAIGATLKGGKITTGQDVG